MAWMPPADDGGASITDYVVEVIGPDGVRLLDTTQTTLDVADLVNGATYSLRVAATNAAGTGAWSESVIDIVPRTTPAAPQLMSADVGDHLLSASWALPATDGGATITGYVVEVTGPDDVRSLVTDGLSIEIPDLANGAHYSVRVAAINAAGTGEWSETITDLVPRTTPGVPLGLIASPGDRSASLAWLAPDDNGGAPITGYVVQVTTNLGTVEYPALDPALALLSLPNDVVHSVRVAAINAAGQGPWSRAVNVRPRAPHVTAPRAVTLAMGRNQARVTWQAPVVGEPVKYVVSVSVDGKSFKAVGTTAARSMYIALRVQQTMSVRVAAVDGYGRGPWSASITRQR